jgi:hypothetical protein
MFNFYTILMTADSLPDHKQFAVDKRVIVRVELTTPRLTGLPKTITNSLSWAHTATKAKPIFTLTLI